MSKVPANLKYTDSHEWVRVDADDLCVIGITEHAQCLLGDLVFVELPDLENNVRSGDETSVVESVKAASDVYSPVTGTIYAVNEELVEMPELVNQDPYGKGWLYKIKPSNKNELASLLSHEQYEKKIAEEEA